MELSKLLVDKRITNFRNKGRFFCKIPHLSNNVYTKISILLGKKTGFSNKILVILLSKQKNQLFFSEMLLAINKMFLLEK